MRYVMVTNFTSHWDNIAENETYYSNAMLKNGMSPDKLLQDTETVFIRLNKSTRIPEKAWLGRVHGIQAKGDRGWLFKVAIAREIPVPEQYKTYREGWYCEDVKDSPLDSQKVSLSPPVMEELEATRNWKRFESLTYFLLKLSGINDIFTYSNQKGMADGFFKIRNFAVLYDCTLETGYFQSKQMQIKNYCTQLASGQISYRDLVYDTSQAEKRVWIITRGSSRLIFERDDILVKEVAVADIRNVYRERLVKNLNEGQLVDSLREL